MTATRPWFPTSAGLLTLEHYEKLGRAVLIFLWFVHEQRPPREGEDDTGVVRNGEPICYEDIGKSFGGLSVRIVERQVLALERQGYIRSEFIRTKGKRYFVSNSIRFSMALPRNPKFDLPETCGQFKLTHQDRVGVPTKNAWHDQPKSGSPIRKQEHKNVRSIANTKTSPHADSHFLPEWLPLDSWEAFAEMRRKIRAPLTEKAIDLTLKELAKLRADGQDVGRVLNQSVQRSWRGVFPVKGTNGHLNKAERRQADNLRAAAEAKRQLGLVN